MEPEEASAIDGQLLPSGSTVGTVTDQSRFELSARCNLNTTPKN